MRIVVQRVKRAQVTVNGSIIGAIDNGMLVLLGVHASDTAAEADLLARKCTGLRIFDDAQGKMNLSLIDVGGSALVVSQFTLFGDCTRGRRPSYIEAAAPQPANDLYEYFVKKLRELVPNVATGVFGAMMDVELVNDGPVTLILEERAGEKRPGVGILNQEPTQETAERQPGGSATALREST